MFEQMTPNAEFNKRFEERTRKANFPAGKISHGWQMAAMDGLHNSSLISLGLNPEDFKILIDFLKGRKNTISLMHFAVISNNLQKQTPKDLSLTLDQYLDLMEEADSLVSIWQEAVNPITDAIDIELRTENEARGISKAGDQVGMKAVKAQA